MDLALPAVLTFFALLPGFIARARLKYHESESIGSSPFGRVVVGGVLWASALHCVWLLASWLFAGYYVQLDVVLALLNADLIPEAKKELIFSQLRDQAALYAWYFGSMTLFSLFVPWILRKVIEKWGLDKRSHPLSSLCRFHDAPWFYLLNGRDGDSEPDFIQLSAVVELGGKPYLYVGVLEEYFFDDEGKPDRFVLSQVRRRALSRDKGAPQQTGGSRFYEVDGHWFVLRYSEVRTLNITFVQLQQLSSAQVAAAATVSVSPP